MKKLMFAVALLISVSASAQKINSVKSVSSMNSINTFSVSSVQSLSNENKPGSNLNSIQNLSGAPYSNISNLNSVQNLSSVSRQDSVNDIVNELKFLRSKLGVKN